MTKETFYPIVLMLGPQIERQDTKMHQAILPNKRVAMAIMKLATPSSLCYITNQFIMASCMAEVVTHEAAGCAECLEEVENHRPELLEELNKSSEFLGSSLHPSFQA
ncbi:hypothetical protein Y1Q_0005005 [Alligator mississippiensis]|uniref:Uncharacterized protein n=1 Tax=Alligator mississippiensis TaxID=8496 RepID=A0A151PJM3_ALLMI|nr:hypothetical protein Y1Q_0005005 [Alligator mississippiensis]